MTREQETTSLKLQVKPLVWKPQEGDAHCDVQYNADTIGGSYCIEDRGDGVFDLWLPNEFEGKRFNRFREAKAFAQVDHERRVFSAIEALP